MLVVRTAQRQDIPAILKLSQASNGKLNTLPMDVDVITHKIERTQSSVRQEVDNPGNEFYFFVLEELNAKKIVGCCAMDACVGISEPFYLYHILKIQHLSRELDYHQTLQLLQLSNDMDGATELCSLYLLPEYRQHYNGRLLSYSRLMFMACFKERFSTRVFADIRGVVDNKERSPFWQGIIRKFIPLSFAEADKLMGMEQRQFIADLMPKFPLYLDLLPNSVKKVIGKPHPSARKAKQMLEWENFHYTDYVNIFDAGPTLIAHKSDIKMLTQSQMLKVNKIQSQVKADVKLIANNQLLFRVIVAPASMVEDGISLSTQAAQALHIQVGDTVLVRELEDNR